MVRYRSEDERGLAGACYREVGRDMRRASRNIPPNISGGELIHCGFGYRDFGHQKSGSRWPIVGGERRICRC